MSGDPWHLAKSACSLVPDEKLRKVLLRAVEWLLAQQYITSDVLPGRVWQVMTGSGMGLRLSSAVSNAAFAADAEIPIIGTDKWNAAGVLYYGRYQDDMLWIVVDQAFRPAWLALWSDLKARAAPSYNLLVEHLHSQEVPFLQVSVRIDVASSSVTCRPRFKEKTDGFPLNFDSSHPPGVLRSWPIAFARSLFRISTRRSDADDAVGCFRERLHRFGHRADAVRVADAMTATSRGPVQNGPRATQWCVNPWPP